MFAVAVISSSLSLMYVDNDDAGGVGMMILQINLWFLFVVGGGKF